MARLRGLGKLYYNLIIETQTSDDLEVNILTKLKSKHWSRSLKQFPDEKDKTSKKRDSEDEVLVGF